MKLLKIIWVKGLWFYNIVYFQCFTVHEGQHCLFLNLLFCVKLSHSLTELFQYHINRSRTIHNTSLSSHLLEHTIHSHIMTGVNKITRSYVSQQMVYFLGAFIFSGNSFQLYLCMRNMLLFQVLFLLMIFFIHLCV